MSAETSPGPVARLPGERFHELDGLRALAITLVLLHHAVSAPLVAVLRQRGFDVLADIVFDTGAAGVELFFVLSGIALLRPYLRRQRRFDPWRYFARRVERLWPPYLTALAGAGAIVFILTAVPTWYSAGLLPPFRPGEWLAQAAIFNFGGPSYNGAWWSLTIELTFYGLAPLLVVLLRPRWIGPGGFFAIVAGSVALAAWCLTVGPAGAGIIAPPDAAARSFAVYLPCFLLGALIAKFDLPASFGRLLILLGIAAIPLGILHPLLDVHAAYGTGFAGLAIVALDRASLVHRLLTRPLAIWLGERSYSLFLVHFSVFYIVDWTLSLVLPGRTAAYGVLSRGIGVPLAVLAAMALFSLVERRFARNLATSDTFWPWQAKRPTAPHPDATPNGLAARS